mmetsp:Transcript_15866/g.31691  ORF Transcript_15866/g.31691 Transcript_15866/m.31691 type:complete len:221 (+) Transcript_15866:1542-2204(+)
MRTRAHPWLYRPARPSGASRGTTSATTGCTSSLPSASANPATLSWRQRRWGSCSQRAQRWSLRGVRRVGRPSSRRASDSWWLGCRLPSTERNASVKRASTSSLVNSSRSVRGKPTPKTPSAATAGLVCSPKRSKCWWRPAGSNRRSSYCSTPTSMTPRSQSSTPTPTINHPQSGLLSDCSPRLPWPTLLLPRTLPTMLQPARLRPPSSSTRCGGSRGRQG